MARIILSNTAPVSLSLLRLSNELITAKNHCDRLRAVVDQITNNGAVKNNLESSSESQFPVGTGAALYDGIGQIQTALTGLASLVSAIDQAA
jgi:hypothetical protein